MALFELDGNAPVVPATAYVAEGATVIGRVTLGEHATVWPGAVIRADDDTITIGARSNIQDGAVLHVDPGVPMTIGSDVTVGHLATLHGCTIGDGSLVGLGAIVYNKAVIGRDCLIGAGAIIPRESASVYAKPLNLRVQPLSDDWALRRFVLCLRSRESLSPAARMLVEHLEREAGTAER